ncbi:MAG: TolC family protein [bacterium]
MKKGLALSIFTILFGNPVFPKEQPLSLKDAISIALTNNQFLKENQKSLEIARLNLISAKKEYRPKIGLESKEERGETIDSFSSSFEKYTISLGYNWPLLTPTSGRFTSLSEYNISKLSDKDPFTPIFSSNPKIGIIWKQPLSKGGRLNERLTLTEKEEDYELGKISYSQSKKGLILNCIISYFNLLKAFKKREYAEKQMDLTQKLLTLTNTKLKAGEISELDVMNVKIRLAKDEDTLIQAKEEERNKQRELSRILGFDEETRFLLTEEPVIVKESETTYLDKMEDILKFRDEIRVFKMKLEKAKRDILIAKSINKPILTLEGNYTLTKEGETIKESLKKFPKKAWAIGCKISWPFFDSGQTANYVKKAYLNYEMLNEKLQELKKDIKEEVLRIENDLQRDIRRINLLSLNLKNLEEVSRITQLKYEMGMVSLKELLEAQMTTFEGTDSLLEAKIDYVINKAKLSLACGRIEEEYVK